MLQAYRASKPDVPIIVDTDTDASEGQLTGPFDKAVFEGLQLDTETGAKGWQGLEAQAAREDDVVALAYTSGTTAKPKGVELTHRGCYLAAMGNVVESGLNFHDRRCHYLWTLPMFHAMGEFTNLRASVFPGGRGHADFSRLDVPLGCDGGPWNPLLSAEDRLPVDLEAAETRGHQPF